MNVVNIFFIRNQNYRVQVKQTNHFLPADACTTPEVADSLRSQAPARPRPWSPRGARGRHATRPARRRRWLPPTRPRPLPPPPRSAPLPLPFRRTLTSSAASCSHRPPPRPAPTPITLPSAASFSAASPPPPFSTEWYVSVPPLLRSPSFILHLALGNGWIRLIGVRGRRSWVQEWRCNDNGYVAYRNFLLRRIDGGSAQSTPSNRLVRLRFFFPCVVACGQQNETNVAVFAYLALIALLVCWPCLFTDSICSQP